MFNGSTFYNLMTTAEKCTQKRPCVSMGEIFGVMHISVVSPAQGDPGRSGEHAGT